MADKSNSDRMTAAQFMKYGVAIKDAMTGFWIPVAMSSSLTGCESVYDSMVKSYPDIKMVKYDKEGNDVLHNRT